MTQDWGDTTITKLQIAYHNICLKMLIQYDLPTKKTPNNIHECSAWLGEFK